MKWNTKKNTKKTVNPLASKTVMDELLGQISGGAAATLSACHPTAAV
jgi:hypothetical protein